jgi:hypothetical protein
MIFWLVLKLEISYNRVIIISWRILDSFRGFFKYYIFSWWNIWVSIILLLPLRYFFNVNGKAILWHTPCFVCDHALTISNQTMRSFAMLFGIVEKSVDEFIFTFFCFIIFGPQGKKLLNFEWFFHLENHF